ncbi:hypothetical protein ORV05_04885 [Amycolatopsis cynarae]|uniref:Uncharacterized protein n=1 Tax=Amycolatopsis cynarae TaxID=2995223 RepID=A0ABY7B490_9PSEU|nr:hypothetical protein [Amycolatopsis sp. HUAS 11-8]WAL67127.1 hypothetical protein ORV05_04885 [Amycolatopsis sp. HUAS 11-8]
MSTMSEVRAPLFISSRLMAALRIDGVGTLHVNAENRDSDGRVVYAYVVENSEGTELETGFDLRSGVGADVDYSAAMGTLLSFLEHAADVYRAGMCANTEESSFSAAVQEWAYLNSEEISAARADFED